MPPRHEGTKGHNKTVMLGVFVASWLILWLS